MAELETLLALVEGWVDTVVADGGRRPAARRGRAARDAAPPPGHRRAGRADLRHPDRPGAAAAPAAGRRRPVARASARPAAPTAGTRCGRTRICCRRGRTWTTRPASSTGTSSSPSCWPGSTTSTTSCWRDRRARRADRPGRAPTTGPTRRGAEATERRRRRRRARRRTPPARTDGLRPPGQGRTRTRPRQTELDGLHRLIPESTACRSMVASSSSSNSRFSHGRRGCPPAAAPTTRRPAPTSPARRAAPRTAPAGPATGRDRRRCRSARGCGPAPPR